MNIRSSFAFPFYFTLWDGNISKKDGKSLPAVDPIISVPKSSAPTEKAIALADRCAANSFNP